jgi:hypothetical protein
MTEYFCPECAYQGPEAICPHCNIPAEPLKFNDSTNSALGEEGKYPEELLEEKTGDKDVDSFDDEDELDKI